MMSAFYSRAAGSSGRAGWNAARKGERSLK
jgi:hypothetical protein